MRNIYSRDSKSKSSNKIKYIYCALLVEINIMFNMQCTYIKIVLCFFCNDIIYFEATRKYRLYSMLVADHLDSVSQPQEVRLSTVCRAVETFCHKCECENLKMYDSLLLACL